TSSVLPTPAGPSTRSSVPAPAPARSRPSRSVPSSRSRSRSDPAVANDTARRYTATGRGSGPKPRGKHSGFLPCGRCSPQTSFRPVDSASELNKRKVRLFVEAVWNEGRLELIDDLVADNYFGRVPGIETGVHGPEGVHRLVSSGRRAHPDLYIKIDDQIAEDDRVATRWRATSTDRTR